MGHSVMEKHVYTASLPRMNVGFGFQGVRPDCLASVSFRPRKNMASVRLTGDALGQ